MAWFAAHLIEYFQFVDGNQDDTLAHENILLIEADKFEDAFQKAQQQGLDNVKEQDSSLRVNDRPVRCIFGGVRKIVSVSHVRPGDQLGDGDEITYSEFIISDPKELEKLTSAESASVLYVGK